MSSIDFDSRNYRDVADVARGLQDGKLPGVWGVIQAVVGHWVISKDERGPLAYGRAALNTFGTLYDYRESKKETKTEGQDPLRAWLKKEGHVLAYKGADRVFTNFLCSAIDDVEYEKRRVRNMVGQFAEGALMEFEIGPGKKAFFVDEGKFSSHGSNSWWFGPFCRPEDHGHLETFVGEHIWGRLGSDTLRLVRRPHYLGDVCTLETLSDDFDFLSCDDTWNDVKAMGVRQEAFLKKGRSRCLLFEGAPGVGKTTLARAIAREIGRRVLVADREAMARLSGGTVSHIISLLGPGVLVLNDVDRSSTDDYQSLLEALERKREKALLTCITVNDVTQLDPALLRPGRVSKVVKVVEPSEESRAKLIRYYADKYAVKLSELEVARALKEMDGFSPSDIREFFEVADVVGIQHAFGEIPRLRSQRELYAGKACEEFNRRGNTSGEARESRW